MLCFAVVFLWKTCGFLKISRFYGEFFVWITPMDVPAHLPGAPLSKIKCHKAADE